VLAQVGTVEDVTVQLVDPNGVVREVHLRLTEKWCATSWRPALQCPRCRAPAVVLRVQGAQVLCARCRPARTAHHLRKNCQAWRDEGAIADKLVRSVLSRKGTSSSSRVARRLKATSLARAQLVSEQALHLAGTVDRARLSKS
jgi:hypothetical protein